MAAHLLGFIVFDGAGVRLFLGDAHRFEGIENGVALDFQFPCQVIDTNFAHLFLFEGRRRLPGPFWFHCALSWSYQPQSKVEFGSKLLSLERSLFPVICRSFGQRFG
jgi:hypothetical protein